MLNIYEEKLLNSDIRQFPLLRAAAGALKSCHKCGHGNVNVSSMLRLAVTKYANDKAFIEHCRSLFPLPCMVGGLLVK